MVSFSANLEKGWRARQGFGRSDFYFACCVVFEFNLSKGNEKILPRNAGG